MPTVALASGPVLAYDDTGPTADADAPVVVLSHGLLMDRTMFTPQVEALRTTVRCIVWDLRAHGATQDAGTPFSYWDSADDLVGLLDVLEVDRAVLVGMGQGGFVSLRVALAHPDRVSAVVLLASQAGTEDPAAAPLYRQLADDWAAGGTDRAAPAFVASIILGNGVEAGPWLERWQAQPPERAPRALAPLLAREDLNDRLGELACPVLVVHGMQDAAIPVDRARVLAERVPDCRGLVLVDGGSHAVNLRHPDEVSRAVHELLADL